MLILGPKFGYSCLLRFWLKIGQTSKVRGGFSASLLHTHRRVVYHRVYPLQLNWNKICLNLFEALFLCEVVHTATKNYSLPPTFSCRYDCFAWYVMIVAACDSCIVLMADVTSVHANIQLGEEFCTYQVEPTSNGIWGRATPPSGC